MMLGVRASAEPMIHEGAANLDLNYPGAGARYFLSGKTAVEGRMQYEKNALSAGARYYWYPPLLPAGSRFNPYLGGEADYVSFKGATTDGSGWSGGAFAGIEYPVSRSFSVQADLGGQYFSVKDKGSGLTQGGLEFVLNFGVNYYVDVKPLLAALNSPRWEP
jgi:hypothetical protein